VNSPRDEIDEWLDAEVTPLYPKTGSLERIRGRARGRKRRQALMTTAGCAVVLAAAVTVPQVISAAHQPGGLHSRSLAANATAPSIRVPSSGHGGARPTVSPATGKGVPDGRATQLHQHTYLTIGDSGTKPPRSFRPTSVTVVGAGTAANPKLVGAVIGQAGPPCYNRGYCTSLAGTSSYGADWYGVSAPVTTAPNGASGVSQLRFTSLRVGWAFGPALYETVGGGWPWKPEDTYGQRVIDVEAAGRSALAIFASCTGTGADYASHCTSFSLYRTTAASKTWTQVAAPPQYLHLPTGQPSSASLVISGGTKGYLLTPSGAVLSGPLSGGTWSKVGQAPCRPGPAQPSGLPADAQLAAGPTLILTCDAYPLAGQTTLFVSANGARWANAGVVPHSGTASSLAAASGSPVVLVTTTGVYYSADNGKTWHPASFGGSAPAGGFSYVGMTNASQGVALPADSGLGEIFVTSDGGRTWTASPIS
jgi:hypothetical protein